MENKALKPTKKVVLLGLDSAGKSSIILALNREMDKISIVQPTKGAQRRVFDFLNLTVIEHDLGGQQRYRQDYLTNPKFLDMTDIAIYVIDVQNKNRVVESLNFLNAIIKRFKEIDIKPSLYIFFHKFDPVKTEPFMFGLPAFVERMVLPESIGKLSLLEEFHLESNKLSSLPNDLENLKSLKKLGLSHNELTTLPEWIGQLSSLEELYLSENKLTSLPESIGKLLLLKELHIYNNRLVSLPESIRNFRNITSLNGR